MSDALELKRARARVEALETVVANLIGEAMPTNWYEGDLEPEHTAAWTAAMEAVGIDPETMKEGNDG